MLGGMQSIIDKKIRNLLIFTRNLKMKKFLFIMLILISLSTFAQQKQQISESDYSNSRIEMADTMRQEGKIYVVVAILGTVLLGVLAYTIKIDMAIGKLEKEMKNK